MHFSTQIAPTVLPGRAFSESVFLFDDFVNPTWAVSGSGSAVTTSSWTVSPSTASAALATEANGAITVTFSVSETALWPSGFGFASTSSSNDIYTESRIKIGALTGVLRFGLQDLDDPVLANSSSCAIFQSTVTTGVLSVVARGSSGVLYSKTLSNALTAGTYVTMAVHARSGKWIRFYLDGVVVADSRTISLDNGTIVSPMASIATASTMTIDYIGATCSRV